MPEIEYAIEIETRTNLSSLAYGISNGFFRFITGRPTFTYPLGDSVAFSITIDGTQSIDVSCISGQCFTASNPPWKMINTTPTIDMVFCVLGTLDFTGGDLTTAKGSSPVAGDLFRFSRVGEFQIEFVGRDRWHEEFIIKKGLGSPSRRAGNGIEQTGDYGTLSGFDFSIKNTNKIWKYLEDNQIYIVNKEIRLYVVMDEVFYQLWDGVVKNIPRTDTKFTFQCIDAFKKLHKFLPPNQISSTEFPNVEENFIGETIPVAVGDVVYNNILNIAQKITGHTRVGVEEYFSNGDLTQAGWGNTFDGVIPGGTGGKPTLYCRGYVVVEESSYIKIVQGAELDKSVFYKVLNSGVIEIPANTNQWYTLIVIDIPLEGLADQSYAYFHNNIAFNLSHPKALMAECFIEVLNLDFTHLVSDQDIHEYTGTSPLLLNWDNNIGDYEDVSSVVISSSTSDSGDPAHPHIKTLGRSIEDDELQVLAPVVPVSLNWQDVICNVISANHEQIPVQNAWKDTASNMIDLDRNTFCNICADQEFWGMNNTPYNYFWLRVQIDIPTPANLTKANIEKMYLMFDWSYVLNGTEHYPRYYEYQVVGIDRYGREFEESTKSIASFQWPAGFSGYHYHLPNAYYIGGNDGGQTSKWGVIESASVSGAWKQANNVEILELDGATTGVIKSGVVPKLRLIMSFGCKVVGRVRFEELKIYQFGFMVSTGIELTGNDLYTRVAGEYSSAVYNTQSNNVYRAFQLMLEKYDGILASRIDYGNIIDERDEWHVGRQVGNQKGTFDYIKELAKQSFVCVVPTRKGERKLVAWLDISSADAVHNSSNIINGSIKNFKLTPISSLYNSFDIKYAWNPGAKKYDKILFIHKVDEDIDDLPADYGEYVGGIDSYPDANLLWKACHHAYEQAEVIQPAPEELSELEWYIDYDKFNSLRSYSGTNSSAFKFFSDFINWTTFQKGQITYELPMEQRHIIRELLDYIDFSDSIYTDGDTWQGWVRKIKYNLRKDRIEITLIFKPREEFETGLIIERGDQGDDTITERGDQGDDTITEGGA